MRTSNPRWRSVMVALCLSLALICLSGCAETFQDVCATGTPEQVTAMIHNGSNVNKEDSYAAFDCFRPQYITLISR